jgi:predicted aconitase with swiveling domain|tara:strand:- start:136 stop:522 length:387 start_codon:yes stop_codon:yes gene_type:complete
MIRCRTIFQGKGTGKALVSNASISFFGGIDPNTGVVVERDHPLFGKSIKGKVLIFPTGKGSTVGSYILLQLSKNGKAPAAIVCKEAEAIVAVGAIMGEIPMVDNPDVFDFTNDQLITVDGFNDAIVID